MIFVKNAIEEFLSTNCELKNGFTYNKVTGNKISACVPMHTFGIPLRIKEVVGICTEWNIAVIEDAAESLGSYVDGKHTGLFGTLGILSFNGNKTITNGGGGAIITNNEELCKFAKHVTTTGKVPHKWDFVHDVLAFNYRMPNINAAIGCAQMEKINTILKNKHDIAIKYKELFSDNTEISFAEPLLNTVSNNWLNAIIVKDRDIRDDFLKYSNENGVMTRPIWTLMTKLKMYKDCFKGDLPNSEWLENRVINIPSGYCDK